MGKLCLAAAFVNCFLHVYVFEVYAPGRCPAPCASAPLTLSVVQVVAHLGLTMSEVEAMVSWEAGADYQVVINCVKAGIQPAGSSPSIGKRTAPEAAAGAAGLQVRSPLAVLGCYCIACCCGDRALEVVTCGK
jgi:hypothetical protein